MKALLIAALLLLVGCKEDHSTIPQPVATPATTSRVYEALDYTYTVIVDKDTCDYYKVRDEQEGIFKCSSGAESFTDAYKNGKHSTTHTSTGIIP